MSLVLGEEIFRSEILKGLTEIVASRESGVSVDEARKSPTGFLSYVLQDQNGKPLYADDVTHLFADAFGHCYTAKKHLSVITMPGFGKTTLALGLVAREIGRNPKLRTVVVSADMDDSVNMVSLARAIVLQPTFKEVYPAVIPDVERSTDGRGWLKGSWFLRSTGMRKDPTMSAVAAVPKREAIRVDIGIFDDLITEKIANSGGHIGEGTAASIEKSFYNTWIEGRLRPSGWALYMQNVRRRDDLGHKLRSDPRFVSMWIGLTADHERLFVHLWNPTPDFPLLNNPEKYNAVSVPVAEISESAPHYRFELPLPQREGWEPDTLRAINPAAKRKLYFHRPDSSEDLLFPNWDNRIIHNATVPELFGVPVDDEGFPIFDNLGNMKYAFFGGLDISSTKRPGTCLTVFAREISTGDIYPLFIDRGRWTTGDIARRLDRLWDNGVRFTSITVETNGVQDMIRHSLTRDPEYSGRGWVTAVKGQTTTAASKWGKLIGFPSFNAAFESGRVHFPDQEKNRSTAWAKHWATWESNFATATEDLAGSEYCPDDLMSGLFAFQGMQKFRVYQPGEAKPAVGSPQFKADPDSILSRAETRARGNKFKF
jgi:hypothetical protein